MLTEVHQSAVPDRVPWGTTARRLARSDGLDRQVVVQPPIIAGGPNPRIDGLSAVVICGRLPDEPGGTVLAAPLQAGGNQPLGNPMPRASGAT
jgi:hypothetical protein